MQQRKDFHLMAGYNLRSRKHISEANEDDEPDQSNDPNARESKSTHHYFFQNEKLPEKPSEDDDDTFQSTVLLLIIFIGAVLAMAFIYYKFPPVKRGDAEKIKVPKSMVDAQDLGRVLSNYKDDFFIEVTLAFMVTYIFLQSFAIPGSIFLSILSGFLFPFPLALFLVCLCSSVGASLCYVLSSLVGKRLVKKYFPDRIARWKKEVGKHEKDILSYIIFLRITPFLPNWFINITSPVLNVPLFPFFLGTFLGVAPPSFGFISAGVELYELTTYGDAFSFKSILLVIVSAVLSLLPVILRKILEKMKKMD